MRGSPGRSYIEDSVSAWPQSNIRFGASPGPEHRRARARFRSGVSPRRGNSRRLRKSGAGPSLGAFDQWAAAFVLPEDVADLVGPVFTHRLSPRKTIADPMEERRSVEGLLGQILDKIPEPS